MPTNRRKRTRKKSVLGVKVTPEIVAMYKRGDYSGCNEALGMRKPWESGVTARHDLEIYGKDLDAMPPARREEYEAGMYYQDVIEEIIRKQEGKQDADKSKT